MVILCASWLNIFWNQLVYISMMSFFSRIGQFAVFPLPLKETMQIDRFEQNKAAHLRKIKLVTTSRIALCMKKAEIMGHGLEDRQG